MIKIENNITINGISELIKHIIKFDSRFIGQICLPIKNNKCDLCEMNQFGQCQNNLVIDDKKLSFIKGFIKGCPEFLKSVIVTCNIVAPLYWWQELSEFRQNVELKNYDIIHKIQDSEFMLCDFSCEHLVVWKSINGGDIHSGMIGSLNKTIENLNYCRNRFLETQEEKWLWQIIQLLPNSYNVKSTINLSYYDLKNIYCSNNINNKSEWKEFKKWIEALLYFKEMCVED